MSKYLLFRTLAVLAVVWPLYYIAKDLYKFDATSDRMAAYGAEHRNAVRDLDTATAENFEVRLAAYATARAELSQRLPGDLNELTETAVDLVQRVEMVQLKVAAKAAP